MQDPAWLARSPEGAYWADDGASVYFRRQREGSDLRDLFTIRPDGSGADRVEDAALARADVSGGDWTRDRSRKVFSRDGDLFVKDIASGVERQLTRTGAGESGARFLADESRVMFRRSGTLLVRDLETGLEWEPADVRFAKTPEEAEKKRDKDKKYLDRQQDRFFEVLRDHRQSREEGRERRRELREIDRSDVPGPFYLPDGLEDRGRHLSPDGKWLIVIAAKPLKGDKRDEMPKYVTESGYVDTVNVRPKVGAASEREDRVFLLDLEEETWSEFTRDSLPTISDDPLAWLREKADEGTADDTDDGEDAAENDDSDEEGDNNDKADMKPRPVSVWSVRWRPDSSMAALMLRSNDNKDRWIALVEPGGDDPSLESIHHLHDEAWIGWSFNEHGWFQDASALWYLSEESGYGNLYLWTSGDEAPTKLAGELWEVSSVRESPDGAWLYFLGNSERPIEYQVHRVGLRGQGVERLSDVEGSVESFRISPDGARLLLTASSAVRPPELSVVDLRTGAHTKITNTVTDAYLARPWIEPEFVAIEGDHGRPIWTKVYQVDGSWEGEGRPGVVFVHGAGYTQNSDDAWPYYFREQMFHSMLAYLGYVVIDMDYRASAGYGRDWRTAIYRNMGRPELEDFSDGIDWMVDTHGVDPEKIGVYGGSYGGFMALMALFLEPETYACGASLRPVTDWAHYNHGYTSNILNTPELDPEAFERSSPIEFAAGLADPLLICHGMLDDNVVYQDTVRLAQRLIELGKQDWEVAAYPLEPHSFTEASSWLDESVVSRDGGHGVRSTRKHALGVGAISTEKNEMTHVNHYTALCALTMAAGLAVAGPTGADQPVHSTGHASWVEATPTGDTTPLPRVAEPDRTNRRAHPPIDQIPPMPLSHVLDMPPVNANVGEGAPVFFDLATREERVVQLPGSQSRATSGGGIGFNGADLAVSNDDSAARSFGTMTEIGDPGAFPWRMNVKLVMRFVDEGGVDRFFVASGSMADAETVLTAGHCVYAHSPNGIAINDWAADIWVYPGWDGVGSANEFSGNWGEAESTGLGSWTGWTVNGSFDNDLGFIRVNRAVGMLTGWYGWWWGGDCASVQARLYNVGSYPAEGCGIAGLHNGRDQYYWWGSYDSCPGQQLQTLTTPGCFTAQWGGMSGGGSYFIDDGSRIVHSVISNSNNATFANHVKQWEGWSDYRVDFVNASRGASFDLQALQARYSDSTPTAGQTITGEFDAPNPTNANPSSATYTFRHYLSTNDFISTADTLIGGSWTYTFDYAAMQNVHINPHSITIPIGTPSGSYYLGVELDPSTDGVDSNDNTTGWDSFPVTVAGVADIVANSLSAPSGTFNPGESFVVSYNIHNQGGDSSNNVGLDFRASLNTIISTGDVQIGQVNTGGLAGNTTRANSFVVTLPPTMSPGTYYIGLISSASDDVNALNNSTFDSIPITVAECVADFAPAYGVLDFDDVLAFLTAFGRHISRVFAPPQGRARHASTTLSSAVRRAAIITALRTPIGRHGGALSSVRPDDLAAHVIRAVVDRSGIDPALIDDVYLGATNQAGEDNRNVARMAALLAGLPESVPGATVNRLCASGLEAVNLAARLIEADHGDVFIAGGVESMSRAPYVLSKADTAFGRAQTLQDTSIGWRFINPKLAALYHPYAMGETAENVARQHTISRDDQDAFALRSQQRWAAAHEAGRFADELVPVEIPQRKGEPVLVGTDEHPRPDTTMQALARLRPAFASDDQATVTAGNSSGINDGAAALLVVEESRARALGLTPLAFVGASASAGVDPAYMGLGPVPAIRKALGRAGLALTDIGSPRRWCTR
eukprot:g5877.t1